MRKVNHKVILTKNKYTQDDMKEILGDFGEKMWKEGLNRKTVDLEIHDEAPKSHKQDYIN